MKGLKIIDRTLELATILTFIGLILVVTIQIMSRYLPYTAIWTEELTRFLFIFSVSFSAPLALKRKEFINIDLLLQLFPERFRNVYEAIIHVIIVGLCAIVVYQGYIFMSIGIGQRSATMAIDMSFIHAAIGVSFLFMTLYAVLHVIEFLQAASKRSVD